MTLQKHFIIEDLQTGDFSHFTTIEDIFDEMSWDYLTNDWNDSERAQLEREFVEMDCFEMMKWVSNVYEYKFHANPDVCTIEKWEEFTGYNWEEKKNS